MVCDMYVSKMVMLRVFVLQGKSPKLFRGIWSNLLRRYAKSKIFPMRRKGLLHNFPIKNAKLMT